MENQPLDGYQTPATQWPGSGVAGAPPSQWTPQRIASKRKNLTELILQQVTLAIRGFLSPGNAFNQLQAWANDVGAGFSDAAGNFINTWNGFWYGVFGTLTGSTGTAADATTAAAYVASTADTADANASLALDNIDDVAKAITGGYDGTAGSALPADVRAVLVDINTRLEALEP